MEGGRDPNIVWRVDRQLPAGQSAGPRWCHLVQAGVGEARVWSGAVFQLLLWVALSSSSSPLGGADSLLLFGGGGVWGGGGGRRRGWVGVGVVCVWGQGGAAFLISLGTVVDLSLSFVFLRKNSDFKYLLVKTHDVKIYLLNADITFELIFNKCMNISLKRF